MFKFRLKSCGDKFNLSDYVWMIVFLVTTPILLTIGLSNYLKPQKSYSGIVQYKFQDQMPDKNGNIYMVDKKLIVKFDSAREPIEFSVTSNTFFSVNKGDRVSFKMSKSELHISNNENWFFLCLVFGTLDAIILFGYTITFLSHFLKNYELVYIRRNRNDKDEDDGVEWWYGNKKDT